MLFTFERLKIRGRSPNLQIANKGKEKKKPNGREVRKEEGN